MTESHRRAFLGYCAATGLGGAAFPKILLAQIAPGTAVIAPGTIREAARLAGHDWSEEACREVAESLSSLAASVTRIDKDGLTNASPLPLHFDPRPPGEAIPMPTGGLRLPKAPTVKRPSSLSDVAFWPATHLAALIRERQVTSVELTRMYLDRLARYNAELNCVVTLTEARAMAEATAADADLKAGRVRGPLHGVPYGVKDIIAARGTPTTWGAQPQLAEVIDEDATVVARLREGGAVLVAKLSTGEMAFGDQWARGRTNNPWNPAEGSSGSSAGSAAATAAGLVGFAIGTDTGGSILSPAVRCGVVGLRPTFGRVSRHGVMAAGTTLDKIGPICRTVDDCGVVLSVIAGPDGLDLALPDHAPLAWDAQAKDGPTRIGYVPAMMEAETKADARANNARALATLKGMGCELREVSLPSGDLSYFIEYVERAAAFDAFTRGGRHASLRPRTSRYLRACSLTTAVDYLQANRRRTVIMQEVARTLRAVDALMFTSLTLDSATSLNPVMSLTGHPSIAVPNGFASTGSPTGVMFSGHLYQEGALLTLAAAYERARGGPPQVPPRFHGGARPPSS
jgi:Asp-tRNA(Asn)/Glu-tRNA(Gln) amidotransferase A subunit family amidase